MSDGKHDHSNVKSSPVPRDLVRFSASTSLDASNRSASIFVYLRKGKRRYHILQAGASRGLGWGAAVDSTPLLTPPKTGICWVVDAVYSLVVCADLGGCNSFGKIGRIRKKKSETTPISVSETSYLDRGGSC